MKFYDRERELAELQMFDDRAETSAQFTVLMGRRRTGKTTLMTYALEGPALSVFLCRKESRAHTMHRAAEAVNAGHVESDLH